MPVAPDVALRTDQSYTRETADRLPAEVDRLLAPGLESGREAAWQEFTERYSRLLLRVAFAFAPGYDGAMDRYLFILEALRRDEFARLRRFAADGRGRFSTWLVVVARRLCVDHHRRSYGRNRVSGGTPRSGTPSRVIRRRLTELAGNTEALESVGDLAQLDPLDAVDHADRGRALQQALAELEPSDRLLLKLRYEQDLTAREIAVLLDLPTPFHVYRRARAVCALLRRRLTRAAASGQREAEALASTLTVDGTAWRS